MKSKRLQDSPATYALIFDRGDDPLSLLEQFAQHQNIDAAQFTGIGAFSEVTLLYFNRQRNDYRKIAVREQVEVLVLVGNISAADDGGVKVHAHVVVGKDDGTAHGGHLGQALVWPTLEVILTESPAHLRRKHDPETGLTFVDLEQR